MIDRLGLVLLMSVTPVAAMADAWDMFVARCLDPYEHLSPEVVTGLEAQPVDQMHEAKRVFGPSGEGYLLVLDGAPTLGERACAVEAMGEDAAPARAWMDAQLADGRYVAGEDGWLVSRDWIEPRLMVRADVDATRSYYAVVETDLES